MQYLLQILHLSCQVQRLPGYQAPWSFLLRNRMAERFASVSEDELLSIKDFSILMYTLFRQRFYYYYLLLLLLLLFYYFIIQTKVLLLYFKIFK